MRTEVDVQRLSLLAIQAAGGAALRNNSGALPREDGVPVRFGLGNTSAAINRVFKTGDLVGIGPGGIFCMWECKRPDWRWCGDEHERAQLGAIIWARGFGGRAGFVTHPDEAVAIMLGTSLGAPHGR